MPRPYRIAFKAGRAFRRGNTKFVDAEPTKGAIILQDGDDGLLHFIWKNRVTNTEEEDLILFPGDASFVKVPQSSWGRTYVLKFASSDQLHFFWMQDADTSRDNDFVENVNSLLLDPQNIPVWHVDGDYGSQAGPSSSTTASAAAANPTSPTPVSQQPSAEQIAHLRQILGRGGVPEAVQNRPEYLLQDILTPANLAPLFSSHPELVSTLFPFLPPDLPVPPSAEVLQQIVGSPQFRSAVRSFDMALASGALTGFVRALGLPEEAGTGFEAFLRAIQEQARQQGGEGSSGQEQDRMQTD